MSLSKDKKMDCHKNLFFVFWEYMLHQIFLVRVTVCHIVIITDNFYMDKSLLELLAKRIKELRKENNFTQDELAFRSEIARSTLGNIETAQNDVTLTKVNRIAKAFNLSLSEFLNF